MMIPIPIISSRPNPEFLKALDAKAIPPEHVRGYKSDAEKNRVHYLKIIKYYGIAYLLLTLLVSIYPNALSFLLWIFMMCPGFIIMAPVVSKYFTAGTILDTIERNYPDLQSDAEKQGSKELI